MDVDKPAQDSPNHILNALNDDCIQSVLQRLDNIQDFLNAAETCVRFQENAKLAFRSQYKFVRIARPTGDTFHDRHTVFDGAHNVLSIFGYLITELHYDFGINDEIANSIADYCGKTLRIFKCGEAPALNYSLVDFGTRFQALEELEIRNTIVYNFKYYSQLKRLTFRGTYENELNFDWLIQAFPKLEFVELRSLHGLEHYQTVEFLKLNPQLISLKIDYSEYITPLIFKTVANVLPNLEKLTYTSVFARNEQLIHIGKLRSLKSLAIESKQKIPCGKLVDSLVENNVPIESLLLKCELCLSTDLNISQLKLLRKLYVSETTDDRLIDYITNLPKLEALACDESRVTLNGIKTALQCATYLSVLEVKFCGWTWSTMDLGDYTSILTLAKSRGIKVLIYIRYGRINVPMEVLEENRRYFNVRIVHYLDRTPLYTAIMNN